MWRQARDLSISTSPMKVKFLPLIHLPCTHSSSQHASGQAMAAKTGTDGQTWSLMPQSTQSFKGVFDSDTVKDSTEDKLPVSECNWCWQECRVTRERTEGRHGHSDTNLVLPHVVNLPVP